MTIQTETVRVSASPVIVLKGKGKAAREMAFMQIAPAAMIETQSRGDLIGYLSTALGRNPTALEVSTAQTETIIGRVAARLPVSELPKECRDDDARLTFARDLVLRYQSPLKPGVKSRLRKGNIGYRTEVQHKVVRAADEYWSQIKAELGIGKAQTQTERNKGRVTRAPSMAGSGKGATPTHEELVTPGKAMTADDACAYVTTQAATLLAFANKHAKVLPTDFGAAIQAFKTAVNAAANAHEVRKAARK